MSFINASQFKNHLILTQIKTKFKKVDVSAIVGVSKTSARALLIVINNSTF